VRVADSASERVVSGAVWADFCDALAAAGAVVQRPGSPADPLDRAEGYRYLTRLLRVALEANVELADPLWPAFRRPAHETAKMGADNPDNHYLAAAIDGAHAYRVWGARGSVHYLGFGSYAGGYGSSARRGQTGYVDARALQVRGDGSLELVASRERRPGNWLPLEPDSSLLIVRQTFLDRACERPAELWIERIGATGGPPPLSPGALARGLAATAAWVRGTAELFADWAEGFARRPNELPPFDPAVAAAAHGDPNIAYYHGYWELADGEALLIEFTPPECEYWNVQIGNHWMESLDFRHHTIALNGHGARRRPDGSVRLVLAHADPGAGNWLDTAGHRRGTLCLRWVGARERPAPRTRVVRASELR
jgi:hypothetical protein